MIILVWLSEKGARVPVSLSFTAFLAFSCPVCVDCCCSGDKKGSLEGRWRRQREEKEKKKEEQERVGEKGETQILFQKTHTKKKGTTHFG